MFGKKVKILLMSLCAVTLLHAMSIGVTYDFEKVPVGALPEGWHADATHPSAKPGRWAVVEDAAAPSGKKILRLTDVGANRGSTFNLCYTDEIPFRDGTISVKFRADSGRIDEGGGIMWRVKDADNYYVVRFNPLEDNFRFYSVKNGVRRQIASADVTLSKGWHEMMIAQKGNRFAAFLDGKRLLEAKDDTFTEKGGVGLWTKADAATSFDDFHVSAEIE
jgi:hypothetical protein